MEKMRQWVILTAVAVVALLAGGWFLLVSPQNSRVASLHSDTASQLQANASLQSQVSQLQQQEKGMAAQQRILSKIGTKVPDNPALPTLIRQLSAAANGAGVDLVSLSPSQPAPVTAAVPGAAPTSSLMQIPVQLTVTGSYFNIESFFRSVEHLSRAMLVTQWSLARSGAGADGKPTNTLQGTLTATVFESPAVAPAATTGTTAPAPAPAAPATTAPAPADTTAPAAE